ncbi:metal ABC transporter substrate-binding protein [Nocardioides jensenii]|uniref:metal ABC transporter substrate-binding protein n=1 Tax=Nocardioides jensenii TaxID=1843 RepID=UPI000830212B|nr:metal ABC transporter substrate-binding protein [Nocardioides jensenii]
MNLPVTRFAVPLALSASLFLAGCGALSGEGDVDEQKVSAAFYPLAYAAERVAGDHFEVENLVQAGREPHDVELSVRQTGDVAQAGLVIFETGFQPAVDEAVEQNAEGETLDAAEVIDLHQNGEDDADQHEGDEHAEDEHADEHEGHDHEQGENDPHFWLDPLLMADLADAIADKLSGIDPDHKDEFTANAADFRAELEALDKAYASGLSSCERDTVVVNHEAFGYLSRYGLHFEAITGLSPGAEPTPGDRARLERLVRADGLTTVFSEALGSKKAAEALAADVGVEAAVLDPIEGLSDLTKNENYLSLMKNNLTALKKANGC